MYIASEWTTVKEKIAVRVPGSDTHRLATVVIRVQPPSQVTPQRNGLRVMMQMCWLFNRTPSRTKLLQALTVIYWFKIACL